MKIGLTGGIGSGKSLVGQVLQRLGYPVYCSDIRAKQLVDSDLYLHQGIVALLGVEAYTSDGYYNKPYVAQRVFANPDLLKQLNAIIHPSVANDFDAWANEQSAAIVFLESAILFESKFDQKVDAVVAVTAPDSVRIERVMQRDGVVRRQVEQRMTAQMSTAQLNSRAHYSINNDGQRLIVPQIIDILKHLSA